MKAPSKTQEENITELTPINEIPEIIGSLFYSESDQAFSMIRFKKEILQKFPQLKDKQGSFCYKMKVYQSYGELKDALRLMEKTSGSIPLLLSLYKKKIEEA